MAPLRPLPDKSSAPSRSILKSNKSIPSTQASSLFTTSKKDKRRIKHAQLLSKVNKPSTTKVRRRRPNKKLVTTLDALADALPDSDSNSVSDNEASTAAAAAAAAGSTPAEQVNVIKRKSMKSRPGALKRKQKLDNSERDRFAKNLAQMAVPSDVGTGASGASSAERLRALRSFIAQTLDKRGDVVSAKG